jgi:hypothetical protein
MTITIPKPIAFLLAAGAALLTVYVLREEIPPLVRYVTKFEAM